MVARIACTNEGHSKQDEGEENKADVLDSRHHGSAVSVVWDPQLGSSVRWIRGREVCSIQEVFLCKGSLVDIS